jgi:hypothetical protein
MDNSLCNSVKNKSNLNIQCTNKKKNNEIFCGVHLNSKNPILFKNNLDILINSQNIKMDLDINIDIVDENNMVICDNKKENKQIYTKSELFEKVLNKENLTVFALRKSIKNNGLSQFIDTKKSKQELLKLLLTYIEKERFYLSNENSIIMIQSIYRMWNIFRRKICNNDTDILTFTDKYEIESKYFYAFYDSFTNKYYAYDIRTLLQIINSNYPSCPYTFRKFTDSEKDQIIEYSHIIQNKGVNLMIEQKPLSIEEQIDIKIKDVFYKINMLDNYTDPNWFKNLHIGQLIELYIRTEDLWNYRTMMSLESKKKIVQSGLVFTIPPQIVKTFKSRLKLQEIILNEYDRMITEGINIEEKKFGAILILTALVEVSHEAAHALPHLMQI